MTAADPEKFLPCSLARASRRGRDPVPPALPLLIFEERGLANGNAFGADPADPNTVGPMFHDVGTVSTAGD
ncbi:hypothetical protein [Rhodococcus tibetensis]|uniref:Uncharacterized protein n=1 Tax=Rhodococcus tibetensis TaxID=2965064 RepID=A0ABT1QBR5_9NOCA|nr:hypothetical protein [Rhodococcus sp. FXJ9.536]MCQ4119714.1 hypothetical protein [Rhodococcus sp. FXJ9.536]